LQENFGARHHVHDNRPDHFWSADDLQKIVVDRPELMAISSHSIRNFPAEVAGRPLLYVTFLREPTEMFISRLKYVRKTFQEQSEEARRWWPSNAPDLSLRDLADSLSKTARPAPICFQTRFFCHRGNFPDTMGHGSFVTAATILDRFFFVGVVGRFEWSIRLLRRNLLSSWYFSRH
jgi:hypothetical protein